ncbi:hypothetical protein BIW11_09100 [Tropilaelaps mercedesae]|uniref:Uncharacterized protein n=1 Tax=Tropilaelaps mercedesae TaxID=418985 RepID=A0A1V9XLW3_9ACAR|nr:hypothetical protein BIW11_09100 [Tropilaelaps mercedesae]
MPLSVCPPLRGIDDIIELEPEKKRPIVATIQTFSTARLRSRRFGDHRLGNIPKKGSLMEKDNQLFRQLLDLHDSITDLRKSQVITPPTPSDMVIPPHFSYFGSISRSSSFSSSESSEATVSPVSSPAGSPLTLTPSLTPSSTPVSSSPSAMSTTSSSRSSYSVKQR